MNIQPRILIIDDEKSFLISICRFCEKLGYEVETVNTSAQAQEVFERKIFNCVILDINLPDENGLNVYKKLKAINPQLKAVAITGLGSMEVAVTATKLGIEFFLTKPFELKELALILDQMFPQNAQQETLRPSKLRVRIGLDTDETDAVESLHDYAESENIAPHYIPKLTVAASSNPPWLKQNSKLYDFSQIPALKESTFERMVGAHPSMRKMFALVEKVANSDSHVLVTGESGTGKELVAQAIHCRSNRHHENIVAINCAAIPRDLLESEMFGHVKGAFTGAVNLRKGRFEQAHNGTLLLDEIGELPLSLQVKLLRVIQEQKFEPVGSDQTKSVDVRLVAATNVDLAQACQSKMFRQDLYYRLNVIPLVIPPLRERKSDIPLLIKTFIDRFNQVKSRQIEGITQESMECLIKYNWPGNIRELENVVERLVILNDTGIIELSDLPHNMELGVSSSAGANLRFTVGNSAYTPILPEEGIDLKKVVEDFENQLIFQALQKTKANRNQAAILLGLNRTTLVEKLKKKGLLKLLPPNPKNEMDWPYFLKTQESDLTSTNNLRR